MTQGSGTADHHMRILRRGWPFVLLVTIVLAGVGVLFSLHQEKLYESSSQVFVDPQNIGSSVASVQQQTSNPALVMPTQAAVAGTDPVLNGALSAAGIKNQTAGWLRGRSTVQASKTANILTFSVTDSNPKVAKALAGAYAQAYVNYRHKVDTGSLLQAEAQISRQIRQLQKTQSSSTGTPAPSTSGSSTSTGSATTPASGSAGSTQQLLAVQDQSQLYSALLQERQDLRTKALDLKQNASVGNTTDAVQTQPHTVQNAILGGILGLFLGIGLLYLRDALNTRVRSVDDLEERLDLPFLGRLPGPSKRLRTEGKLSMLETPNSPETEAIRIVAANLEFANLDRGARTIMVTSAVGGEGKSTTIGNLAVSLARAGRRVILVDLDMRRPIVDRFFGVERSPGVSEVILGHTDLDTALRTVQLETERVSSSGNGDLSHASGTNGTNGRMSSDIGSLQILTSGLIPPNPPEFVRSPHLAVLLKQLESRADLVLIDAPPILHVSDAVNLTTVVDALFIVARLPKLRRAMVDELRRRVSAAPTAQLGLVVTGESPDDPRYGYSYGYGYGYGYGSRPKKEQEEDVPSTTQVT